MTRVVIVVLGLLTAPVTAGGARPSKAAFTLVIGVNRSVDSDLRLLRYADDDAVRYFELFRALGHRTYLLTRPDANTRRLHPQAAAEAYPPRRSALQRVVRLLAAEMRRARERGVETVLYFIYAGHGHVRNGEGYLSLEDHRMTAAWLGKTVLAPLKAHRGHLIVDACHSLFLARSRGPGGTRRPLRGFSGVGGLDRRFGLLLSTSATRESHEWEAFQAGVFSHEVRSGLYGAADADGDGTVSYREIAAFVHNANTTIPNERFRPRVFARPPRAGGLLLDIRWSRRPYLEVGPSQSGRYLLETSEGVRLADFHSSGRTRTRLLRPPARGLLYLRRPGAGRGHDDREGDEREYAVKPGPRVIRVAALAGRPPRVAMRGAAHHAFSRLFEKPFDRQVVATFRMEQVSALAVDEPASSTGAVWRRRLGWASLGVGAAALGTAVSLSLSAASLRDGVGPGLSHEKTLEVNRSIDRRNTGAVVLYCVAGAAAVGGILALVWPDGPRLTVGRRGWLAWGGEF